MAVGRPPQHTADDFVESAIALADAEGLEALTLQRLGVTLGVSTTAVYRYFPDKQALITAMRDHQFAHVASLSTHADVPADQIVELAMSFRTVANQHPSFGQLLLLGASGGALLETLPRVVLSLLEQIGLSGELLVRGYRQLETLVMGSAIFDFSGAPHHLLQRYNRLSRLQHPAFAEYQRSVADVERCNEEAMRASVEAVLDALVTASTRQVASHVD